MWAYRGASLAYRSSVYGDEDQGQAVTSAEILSALRQEVTEDGHVLLDLLATELGLEHLPNRTFAAALEFFGPQLYNKNSRAYKSLHRRVEHALRVWAEKYGGLNAKQADYADLVLEAALKRAAKDAAGDVGKLFTYAQAGIGRIVNHERVHQGFTSRAETVRVGDVMQGLLDVQDDPQ